MTDAKPLTALVAQGWEIVSYAAGVDASGFHTHNVLMRRQKQHKVLQLRSKWLGSGLTAKEIDI